MGGPRYSLASRCAAVGLLLAALACDRPPRPPPSGTATSSTAEAQPAAVAAPKPPTPTQPPTAFEPPDAEGWGRAGQVRYLERVHGGAAPDASLPLVVMIHGLGDKPRRDWLQELPVPARVVLPQAPIPYHEGYSWFTYRVRDNDPQELARGIARAAEQLAEAIAILQRERPTLGKPIVSGFSQGGMLSFALALHHGSLFSLAHPLSGMLPRPLWPETRGAAPPIRALHGDSDPIVPHPPAEALVQHLASLGYDAELELFPGVGHRVSPAMGARMTATLVAGVRAVAGRPGMPQPQDPL